MSALALRLARRAAPAYDPMRSPPPCPEQDAGIAAANVVIVVLAVVVLVAIRAGWLN